jgi:hypothetical protein
VRSARHSSASTEHLTPLYIVDASRKALGGAIDVDPATTVRANQDVKARFAFTIAHNGLRQKWNGTVFLNPPGGTIKSKLTKSSAVLWWVKLMLEWTTYRVTAGIFVGFTIEVLQQAQKVCSARRIPQPLDFPLCVPERRLSFDTIGKHDQRISQRDPTHANVIVYLPSRDDPGALRFRQAFGGIGKVKM